LGRAGDGGNGKSIENRQSLPVLILTVGGWMGLGLGPTQGPAMKGSVQMTFFAAAIGRRLLWISQDFSASGLALGGRIHRRRGRM